MKRRQTKALSAALALSAFLLGARGAQAAWTRRTISGTAHYTLGTSPLVTLSDGWYTVEGSSTSSSGGAFYLQDWTRLLIDGTGDLSITNNKATARDSYGGASYTGSRASVTIDVQGALTFDGNTAWRDGGAIYASYNSTVTLKAGGHITLNNNKVVGNGTWNAGNGGAINAYDRSSITIDAPQGLTVSNNSSNWFGGAIYLNYSSKLKVSGAGELVFSGNFTHYQGSAILIRDGSSVTIGTREAPLDANLTFSGNRITPVESSTRGGAIAVRDRGVLDIHLADGADGTRGVLKMTGNTSDKVFNSWSNTDYKQIEGVALAVSNYGTADIEARTIILDQNSGTGYGSALAVNNRGSMTLHAREDFFARSNDHYGNGGALYLQNGSLTVSAGRDIVISSNSAGRHNNNATGNGAAVRMREGPMTLTAGRNVTFADNTALDSAGAVWADRDGVVAITAGESVSFLRNRATNNGGALRTSLNREKDYDVNYLTLKAQKDILFDSNVSQQGSGGGTILEYGIHTIEAGGGLTFVNNSAALYAGGYGSTKSTTTTVTAGRIVFDSNSAASGGGMWLGSDAPNPGRHLNHSSTAMKAETITFTDNKATFTDETVPLGQALDPPLVSARGGAIMAEQILNLNASDALTFTGNTAKAVAAGDAIGGGIASYSSDVALTAKTLTMTGNRAEAADGNAWAGALYNYHGNVSIDAPALTIDDNSAQGTAGAFGGMLAVENGKLHVTADQLKLTRGLAKASDGLAFGGGAYATGSLTVNVTTADISANRAEAPAGNARGGAMHTAGNVHWTTADGGVTAFENNTATAGKIASGAAVWASGDITFDGGAKLTVTNNDSTSTAKSTAGDEDAGAFGAVTLTGGNLTLQNIPELTFADNTADGPMARGGATALRSGTLTASARQLTYKDNSATASSENAFGGAVYTAGGAGVAVAYATLTGNKAESTASEGIARGGAVYAGGAMNWATGEGGTTEFSGNTAKASGLASGAAVYAHGDLTFSGGNLDVHANSSDAGSTGQAYGAFVLGDGHLKISTPSGDVNFAENTASGAAASGGAFALRVGEVDVNAANVTFAKNKAIAAGGAAQGGAFFAEGDATVAVTADTLTIKGNSAEATGGNALGGALNSEGGTFNVTVNEASITGNAATAEGEKAMARGGAVFAGGDLTWKTSGRTTFSGNTSTGETLAGGAAIAALNSLTIDGGIVVFESNESQSGGEARGAMTVDNGHLKIKTTGANEQFQFIRNTARGVDARGGGVTVLGGDADVSSTTVDFEGNRAIATSGTALGGAIYSSGIIDFDATRTLYVRNNSAEKGALMMRSGLSSAQTTASTRGGGFYASGDIHITIGHDGSASAEEETAVGRAVFRGNAAELGGALYSENGNITLTRASDAGGIFNFATNTDDVFARRGAISVKGMLLAKPGTSFTAAQQFTLERGSSVTLDGKDFTVQRSVNDLTIFAGHNDSDIQSSINFNRAHLTLLGHGATGRQMIDVAAVMYKTDPGVITNGVSADITRKTWALDVSDYRNARLWMHKAISLGTETDAIQKEEIYAGQKGYDYLAKLVLDYDRHTLIWRGLENYNGSQPKWNEADKENLVWLMAESDDYFTPRIGADGKYIRDSFYRGDIVVFDGKVYNDGLTSNDVLSGDQVNDRRPWTVPLTPHTPESGDEVPNISASEVYITGGQYKFTGDQRSHLRTDLLIISGDNDSTRVTSADFGLPVRVWENLSVGTNSDATFTNLFTLEDTPVSIAGTMRVQSPTNGAYTVHGGGQLSLGGGSGMVNSLSVKNGGTLNINTLGAYKVNGSFTAEDGSHTIVTPAWDAQAKGMYALMGEGEASASVGEKAKLTLHCIGRNSTGKWMLLKNFTRKVNATDNTSWGSIDAKTLTITGADKWDGPVLRKGDTDAVAKLANGTKYYLYEVKKEKDDKDYVLVITEQIRGQEEKDVEIPDNPTPGGGGKQPNVDPEPENKYIPTVVSNDVTDDTPETPSETDPREKEETPSIKQPEQPGHTDAYHIASSVQRAISRAALEPRPKEHLWASFWRDTGRVYDTRDDLALKTRAYGVILGRDLSKNYKKTWGVAAHIGKGDTSGKGWWDGATSDTNFWGLMVYGRRDEKKWFFSGDASFNWFKTDYTEANGSSADNARSTMFSIGGRAYYKWIDNPQPGQMSVHPFIGARWNYYRQSGYTYDTGDHSRAWKSGQLHVPMGIKIQWGEMESKDGWHVTPTLEASYIRTIGQRSAVTGIHAPRQAGSGVRMPLSARDTFAAEFRYVTRNEKKGFHWELNAGIRRSTSEKDLHVGTTFKWEL